MKKNKLMILVVSLLLILLAAGVYLFPIFRYMYHRIKTDNSLPNDIYTELPLYISQQGRFQIKGLINNVQVVNLNIDNMAISLMREDSIAHYSGTYWGSLPFNITNAYLEESKIRFYSFNSIKIGDIEIKTPLFNSISKDNLIYDILDDGVLGSNLRSIGCWKFDTENKLLKFFNSQNHELIKKETKGFTKIKNGLRSDSLTISIGHTKQNYPFSLDLGYSGIIEINNDIADILKQDYPYYIINRIFTNERIDTLYVFDNIPTIVAGINIPNCQMVNIRSVNGNYIGAMFMNNFNFLLIQVKEDGHNSKNLYLNARADILPKNTWKLVSKFGFGINRHNDKIVIESIKANSIADKAGLILGDEIIEINGCKEDLLFSSNIDRLFIQYTDTLNSLEIKTKQNNILTLHATNSNDEITMD